MLNSRFVVIEGPNGAGKTTVSRHLAERWRADGREVRMLREPSTSDIGGLVRKYREFDSHALTLACLVAADRYSNLEETIRPAKALGIDVISDRYAPSHFVYQTMHGVPSPFLEHLNTFIAQPDLTILLDVEYDVLKARVIERGSESVSENVANLEAEVKLYGAVESILNKLGHPFVRIRNWPGQLERTLQEICDRVELQIATTE